MQKVIRIIIIVLLCYIALCFFAWASAYVNYSDGLFHGGFISKKHAQKWGASVYDVNVIPNTLTVNGTSVEITEAWVEVCQLRRFYPVLPFIITVDWDWKVIHLCLNTEDEQACGYNIEEIPQSRQMPGPFFGRRGFLRPNDPVELNGYLVTKFNEDKISGTDFKVHIPWETIRKDWNLDSFVWYPDCNDSDQGKKTIRFNIGLDSTRY